MSGACGDLAASDPAVDPAEEVARDGGARPDDAAGAASEDAGEGGVVADAAGPAQIVANAQRTTCARLANGTATCWGETLSPSPTAPLEYDAPTPVAGLREVAGLDVGLTHACALLADGTARCWGQNVYGQLGNGESGASRTDPVAVAGLRDVAQVSTGATHTCARRRDGTVVCWGRNDRGQLGADPSEAVRLGPGADVGLTGVVEIGAGYGYNCARLADGTVQCWGDNRFGQLGDGTSGNARATPAPVAGLSDVVGLDVGPFHSCARTSGGGVRCWGLNSARQVSPAAVLAQSSALAVEGVTDAVGVTVGEFFTCAWLADGTARCWGANSAGQLGDGSQSATSATPVTVAGLREVVELSAGSSHVCARLAGGALRCWGDNAAGQLGDGTRGTTRTAPTPVVGFE